MSVANDREAGSRKFLPALHGVSGTADCTIAQKKPPVD
jgi:hypothetical protein